VEPVVTENPAYGAKGLPLAASQIRQRSWFAKPQAAEIHRNLGKTPEACDNSSMKRAGISL
jgi:hypothetical protein